MDAINLYRRLIVLQMRAQLQYPVSFWLEIAGNGLILFTFFGGVALVFQRFGHIADWTLGEIAFLWGTVEMAFGMMDMIFSGFDPGNFGQQVRLGRFDQLLLRPINITASKKKSRAIFFPTVMIVTARITSWRHRTLIRPPIPIISRRPVAAAMRIRRLSVRITSP